MLVRLSGAALSGRCYVPSVSYGGSVLVGKPAVSSVAGCRWRRTFCVASPQHEIDTSLIGFIGLGNMGSPMASNLMNASGHKLIVYDIDSEKSQSLAASGAKIANSVQEVARQATCLITMLPAAKHVEDVYFGNDGILNNLNAQNTFLLECSTIGYSAANKVIAAAAKANQIMLDCPTSGGVIGAKNRTLTFMVGGQKQHYTEANKVLSKIAKNVFYCGRSGMGQAAKVCNNLILGITMHGVAEACRLADEMGMDSRILTKVINSSSGRCWSSDTYNPVPHMMQNVPAERSYENGFSIDLIAKDLKLALVEAQRAEIDLPFTDEATQSFESIQAAGKGHLDIGYIYKHFK